MADNMCALDPEQVYRKLIGSYSREVEQEEMNALDINWYARDIKHCRDFT